ncbi:MAG: DUF4330 family protein [Clostridia bacterium]|nr:DUF4330 family protein [Clostridia bacterium]
MKNNNAVAEKKTAKVKRRFNFIDVLIILAIVLLGAIVLNLFFPNGLFKSSSVEKKIQYTVEFVGVDEAFVDKIKENDSVIDSVAKYNLGSVMTVDSSMPYTELKYDNEAGVGHLAAFEDKYNVLVTVSVVAEYNEGEGYSVGDRRIAVGEKLSLRFPNYASEGYCVSLSVEG